MFGYYVGLALRGLRRNIALTALMVIAIGVGIGASMTMLTIFRAASGDPIPEKSARLFAPQIDNIGPRPNAPQSGDRLPLFLTYLDVTAWMHAHAAVRQAAMYPTTFSITPPDPDRNPIVAYGLATYGDFFPMFDVPFRYGGPWTGRDDDRHAAVVVLTQALNERLFSGTDSVGRTLSIGDQPYRIIGVLAKWHPSPRFYNPGGFSFSVDDQLFVPFTRAIDEQRVTYMNLTCDRASGIRNWEAMLLSNCIWMRFWVELPTARDVANYRAFLRNYAADQQRSGRFPWAPHVALRSVTQWLSYNHIVPPAVDTLTGVSFAVLAVCILNAIGVMLASVMTRAGAVGVRRAMGATRAAIFAQCMVEAGVIGLAGAVLGLGLTRLGLVGCRAVLDRDLTVLTRLHGTDVLIAIAASLAATLLAGLYPTWRAMQVQPALQLKTL